MNYLWRSISKANFEIDMQISTKKYIETGENDFLNKLIIDFKWIIFGHFITFFITKDYCEKKLQHL